MLINILKVLIAFSIILSLAGCSVNQIQLDTSSKYEREDISKELLARIRNVIEVMLSNDIDKLNEEYIHNGFGFYNIYYLDNKKSFLHQNRIYKIINNDGNEISDILNQLKYDDVDLTVTKKDIQYGCDLKNDEFFGWDDDGVFISSNTSDHLTELMKIRNESSWEFSNMDFYKAGLVANTSYKVIITPDLIFYMTKLEDNWYITLFDRISTQCQIKK